MVCRGASIRRLSFEGGGEESRGVSRGTVGSECPAPLTVLAMPSIMQLQWRIHFSGRSELGPKTYYAAVATVQTTADKLAWLVPVTTEQNGTSQELEEQSSTTFMGLLVSYVERSVNLALDFSAVSEQSRPLGSCLKSTKRASSR